MRLQRFVAWMLVFASGMVAGGLILRAWTFAPPSADEAERRALSLLDRPPVVLPIGDNKIVAAIRCISPAVVNIDTVGRVKQQDENGKTVYVDQEVRGKGSGVVLSPDGYIVTNDHVIDGASRIRVTFVNNRWYYANLIGRAPEKDLAVIRVEAHHLVSATLGDSDHLQVGESAIAIGNPLGLGSSVTCGIVSALNRRNLQIDEGHNLDGAIQTDASINRGNSGGALVNINGQVIGINTAILSAGPGGGSIGLGFALPINTVRHIVRDLIATGHHEPHIARRPWLGIDYNTVPENVSVALGIPAYCGARVNHVLPETPASLAGLEEDDIILRIDKRPITNVQDVSLAIARHKPGDHAVIHILRPRLRRQRDIVVTIQEHPEAVPLTP